MCDAFVVYGERSGRANDMVRYHQTELNKSIKIIYIMVGWFPKLVYTQTNMAVVFFFLWIKHVYDHWAEINIYMPQTLQGFWDGCDEVFTLHWPLLVCLAEIAICWCIIFGIRRNAPTLTIQASSTEMVPILD